MSPAAPLMDITTMVLALALGNLALSAALFFYAHGGARALSLSTFTVAKQCQAGGWLLLYLSAGGVLPGPLAVVVGYPVLFTGVALEAGALWEASERPRWRRVAFPLLALSVVLYLVCYLVDDLGLRVLASSLILGGFYLSAVAALATGWRGGSMLRRFLVLAMALLSLLVASRALLVLLMPQGWSWINNAMLPMLVSGAFYMLMLLGGFGFLLLAREREQQELARLLVVDALTDVPNRRGLFQALAPWMALARRPGPPTSMIVLEFDQFKRLNDSYGHPAGDTVLRALVDVCKNELRDSDQIGRLVGVEFAVLLPRTGQDEALLVADRIRAAIEATPVKTGRAMVGLTASFGVTALRADDSTVSLFQRADQALQRAKADGRNRIAVAPPPEAPPA
ncbi:GGDEF domain-containing protein [Massilia glaciei]|nr:diguanylate cyclase [Massilia glaciei]